MAESSWSIIFILSFISCPANPVSSYPPRSAEPILQYAVSSVAVITAVSAQCPCD